MDTSEEEEAVLTAQKELETALAALEAMPTTAYLTGSMDANVTLIMQKIHKIQVQEAQSDVTYAKLQLENAQKYLESAKVFQTLLEQLQTVRKGKNLAGKLMQIYRVVNQRKSVTKLKKSSFFKLSHFSYTFLVVSLLSLI